MRAKQTRREAKAAAPAPKGSMAKEIPRPTPLRGSHPPIQYTIGPAVLWNRRMRQITTVAAEVRMASRSASGRLMCLFTAARDAAASMGIATGAAGRKVLILASFGALQDQRFRRVLLPGWRVREEAPSRSLPPQCQST